MPSRYDRRHVLRKTLQIFAQSGQVMALKVRINPVTPTPVPADLFAAQEEPTSGEFNTVYILGTFNATSSFDNTPAGKQKQITGTITVPLIYETILAKADYIDPYNDGSLFMKNGKSFVDSQNVFITQAISGVTFPDVSETTQQGF